jgi:hypothetical protein
MASDIVVNVKINVFINVDASDNGILINNSKCFN